MKVEMRRLLFNAGQAKPILLYPIAAILGVLSAYCWFLFFYAWYMFFMGGPD
jgi:hypothetical protein